MAEWILTDKDIGMDGAYYDYPELIRCKDCKYYREYAGVVDGYCHMAEWYKRYQYPDDYCSRAERRTE